MLRGRLQRLTEEHDVSRHPALLARVTCECPNSISIVESPHPIGRYTCLMHVLDFAERPEYIAIACHGLGRVFAGEEFAHWLIGRGLLVELSRADARDGDLVIYFSEDTFKHVGLWRPNCRVLSKWGVGHLYYHELFEVPMSYGTDARFFKRLSYSDAYDAFTQFAAEKGVPVEGAAYNQLTAS